MEIEITEPLRLDERQRALLDLHSFVNLLNVLLRELHQFEARMGTPNALRQTVTLTEELKGALGTPELAGELSRRVSVIASQCGEEAGQWLASQPRQQNNPGIHGIWDNLQALFAVLALRTEEYLDRLGSPDQWRPHSISQLRHNLEAVLVAMEMTSQRRFHMAENLAALDLTSYLVRADIHSLEAPQITMPPVIQDVLRDLVANARKYSPIGLAIHARLLHNGTELCLVVEDHGFGIPEKELPKVIEFGYRAVNVRFMATQGSGFGLTKAWWVTQKFGGRMWIKSEVGVGTRVTIKIPAPA